MQSLGRRFVRHFNDRHHRTGTLWEGRYKSSPFMGERHFLQCQRHIELNPVRAAMVADPLEYPWSSHRAYAKGDPDPLLHAHGDPGFALRRAVHRVWVRVDRLIRS